MPQNIGEFFKRNNAFFTIWLIWPNPCKEPLPRGHEIYNFARPFLGHHNYILSLSVLCVGVVKKIFKELSSKSSREDMYHLPTSFLLNIQSRVKQEVDMRQIQNCVTRYSSPYWCSVPNIRKLACVVPWEKCDRNFLWRRRRRRRRKTTEVIPICRLR